VILAVPLVTPVSTPVLALMVATEGCPLVHAPPGELQISVVVAASHTDPVPAIERVRF
jgi:hypothetical protein